VSLEEETERDLKYERTFLREGFPGGSMRVFDHFWIFVVDRREGINFYYLKKNWWGVGWYGKPVGGFLGNTCQNKRRPGRKHRKMSLKLRGQVKFLKANQQVGWAT